MRRRNQANYGSGRPGAGRLTTPALAAEALLVPGALLRHGWLGADVLQRRVETCRNAAGQVTLTQRGAHVVRGNAVQLRPIQRRVGVHSAGERAYLAVPRVARVQIDQDDEAVVGAATGLDVPGVHQTPTVLLRLLLASLLDGAPTANTICES